VSDPNAETQDCADERSERQAREWARKFAELNRELEDERAAHALSRDIMRANTARADDTARMLATAIAAGAAKGGAVGNRGVRVRLNNSLSGVEPPQKGA
jgi:hypothetical protein